MSQELSPIAKKRHSLAHILAKAVLKLRPNAKLGIGPTIEDGFYYDFYLPSEQEKSSGSRVNAISESELAKLTQMMRGFLKQNLSFERDEKPVDEAIDYLKKQHQPFKVELVEDLKRSGETTVSFYQTDDFIDLCRGGHVQSTKEIDPQSFTLTKIAGAYWKGSAKNPQLQRIYGVAFETKKELDEYLKMIEEAKKRDHRQLGRDLDLFTFSPLVGAGLPLYTEKGTLLRRLIQDFTNTLQEKASYNQVWTPQIGKIDLFKTSGHYEKFKNDMFVVRSNYTDEIMYLKPMNCPMHTQIYASKPRSWRDLPVRYADFAMLYRDEKPGELTGLSRVRAFSQDDAHIFCREDQIEQEFDTALSLVKRAMAAYGLSYWIRLSVRDPKTPEKYLGDPTTWDKSEELLENILRKRNVEFQRGEGEAAFYGPKMDLVAKDSLRREWQLSTIQIDFQMPDRFKLEYTDKDGNKKTPVMIHRAIHGSLERFIAVIIEHYAGKFPVWLAPVQVQLIPISEKFIDFAQKVATQLLNYGVRSGIDSSDETVSKKIRHAQLQFVPYMLVLGEREQHGQLLAVRTREGQQKLIKLADLIGEIKQQIPTT